MRKRTIGKILCITLAVTMSASLLTACGDRDKEDAASDLASKIADAAEQSDGSQKDEKEKESDDKDSKDKSEKAAKDMADKLAAAVDENVDEKWIKVLEENGTFYDAFYNYRNILKEEEPNHPDNVKMPDGIIKENAEKAQYYASKTLRKVQKKVGFPERPR